MGRHVTLLEHITLIPSQPVFNSVFLEEKAANINFIVTHNYLTQDEHTNHNTTNVYSLT